ncbi:UDP-N-acetylmuramyl peptide synthase [Lactobacillus taiwanensis]|uniref:Lipid II isoglutaminyl synthase (glutamine-hydrolyzing) subunit MurT n=1 Tax=Lactobacillus taiwanensis TaxID=508451 RepID=A0A256LG96_9LACO|nr:Mur ligase family protein [Lactobacillus taiwanensis]OYR88470.1 UDP-N-acetylmuramyl peptide synthase [Lactobacillus taiwanensis]OYR92013.1 UDP-N-acetylmuramyl peptide synthase [Lactobacillus taiwanensis]OYR92173.1 UDP-N-acetylmuramyl peptide synthase [Lactobacillus taiwanensis]OYR94327.1 UDP-N-acetylmuramyl peptide synthase [Lactobacillus taiwanensis]OYS18893.1 UDP-N-acetylmuramyl peptide synthase [Lactobacillus taiwanensis]
MNLKSGIAKAAGKSSYWFLHNVLKGGTSFPGKFAMKIDPEVLNSLAKGYETIIVTGTNGKTMTTALIVEALKKKYGDILTNPSGSNMQQGIVTAFLAHKNKRSKKKIAVLEVDEANVKMVTKLLHPSVFVLTNIFRDQMDRYGEIYTTYKKIVDGIKLAPDATIIANGDASIFSSVNLPNKKVFYGFKLPDDKPENDFKAPVNTDGVLCPKCDHILHYHERIYANLGDYFCPNCGYHRPDLTYTVNEIIDQTPNSLKFKMGEKDYSIGIGGTYNIYNALAAYSVAREFGLTDDEVAQSFAENKRIFGRQELINYAGKEIDLILVKNPVGLDEVLHMLNTEKDRYSLVTLLNANHADGIDTSWIWDADYEGLNKDQINKVIVGGKRWHDMGFRLEVSGFDPGLMTTATDNDAILAEISKLPTKKVYILATYTAMLSLRKTMGEKKIIKAGM